MACSLFCFLGCTMACSLFCFLADRALRGGVCSVLLVERGGAGAGHRLRHPRPARCGTGVHILRPFVRLWWDGTTQGKDAITLALPGWGGGVRCACGLLMEAVAYSSCARAHHTAGMCSLGFLWTTPCVRMRRKTPMPDVNTTARHTAAPRHNVSHTLLHHAFHTVLRHVFHTLLHTFPHSEVDGRLVGVSALAELRLGYAWAASRALWRRKVPSKTILRSVGFSPNDIAQATQVRICVHIISHL